MKKTIGFIGLGAMGKPMAINLINAGYPLVCYDINSGAMDELAGLGAQTASSSADLAERSHVVITMLPADKQILEVYLGDDGIFSGIKDGSTCIDMTSAMGATIINVANAAAEAGKTLDFLDAPVSGGVPAAQGGTLTIMAGGDRAVFDACQDILGTMGKRIFYTGGIGSGKSVKTINQLLNACNTYVISEALSLAKSMNLDMDILREVINESSGSSWVFQNNLPKFILPQVFENGFTLELMNKDVGLGIEQARAERVSMPIITLIGQIYQSMCNQGQGKQNYNVVTTWIDQQNNGEK